MFIECKGLDLSDALITVSKAISNKITNPIFEGIKMSADEGILTLSATDMELTIEKKIKADVITEGEAIVPGRFITELIKKLTNEVISLEVIENKKMKIKYDDSETIIQLYNVEEYPTFKGIESNDYISISNKDFKSLVAKTVFAVAVDDSRPILKGVLFDIENDYVNAVALDGFRLAKVKKEIKSNVKRSIVIPAKALNEMSRLVDDNDEGMKIYLSNSSIMVDLGDTKITSRLLEGDFVNYRQIISSNYETICITKRSQFLEAIERAFLLSKIGQENVVKFDIKEKSICITSNSEIGNVREIVPSSTSGSDVIIGFNAEYFLDTLRTISDEYIKICMNKSASPAVIVPTEGDEYLFLILPVRVI